MPTDEVCQYLLARYGDRFNIHPKKYEDAVGSIFRSVGYEVRVTSYSGDNGIDIFVFDGPGNKLVGVQVKRFRGKVEAEQIRSFAGALVLAGVTQGVFVTSSDYRSGAVSTARNYNAHGLSIELWNAKEFYDRLQLCHRTMYAGADDPSSPFFELWRNQDKMPRVVSKAWGYD
jgi:restriction system protein